MGPVHGRFNCIKVLIYLKYFDLRRELQSSLLIQRHLGKCFPTFSQSSRYLEADTAWSRGPSYCLSRWQTLASCWSWRNSECKSYGLMRASTKISKESLRDQTMHGRVRILARLPVRGRCVNLRGWGLSCNGEPRKLEMIGMWNVHQGKQATNGASPGKKVTWATNGKAVRARLPKPWGAHMTLPCGHDL